MAVRTELDEGSLLGVALAGANDHGQHVELADPLNSWLYVSKRFVDYPGKVTGSTVVRCSPGKQNAEWMKEALKEGLKYLENLG